MNLNGASPMPQDPSLCNDLPQISDCRMDESNQVLMHLLAYAQLRSIAHDVECYKVADVDWDSTSKCSTSLSLKEARLRT